MLGLCLIIEDEVDLATTLEYNLTREGYQVRVAHTGRGGLDAALIEPTPDVVVLDLMLPDLSGTEVCRRLREHERTRDIPIVMCTAKGSEIDRVVGEHPAVKQVVAVAVAAELGEDDILVAVVKRDGAEVAANEIADWCAARLAPMKVPRYVIFLEALPMTPTSKINKAALRQDATLRERAVDLGDRPDRRRSA